MIEKLTAVGPVAPGWADNNLVLHTHVEGSPLQPYTTVAHLEMFGLIHLSMVEQRVERELKGRVDAARAADAARIAELEAQVAEFEKKRRKPKAKTEKEIAADGAVLLTEAAVAAPKTPKREAIAELAEDLGATAVVTAPTTPTAETPVEEAPAAQEAQAA